MDTIILAGIRALGTTACCPRSSAGRSRSRSTSSCPSTWPGPGQRRAVRHGRLRRAGDPVVRSSRPAGSPCSRRCRPDRRGLPGRPRVTAVVVTVRKLRPPVPVHRPRGRPGRALDGRAIRAGPTSGSAPTSATGPLTSSRRSTGWPPGPDRWWPSPRSTRRSPSAARPARLPQRRGRRRDRRSRPGAARSRPRRWRARRAGASPTGGALGAPPPRRRRPHGRRRAGRRARPGRAPPPDPPAGLRAGPPGRRRPRLVVAPAAGWQGVRRTALQLRCPGVSEGRLSSPAPQGAGTKGRSRAWTRQRILVDRSWSSAPSVETSRPAGPRRRPGRRARSGSCPPWGPSTRATARSCGPPGPATTWSSCPCS